MFNHEEGNPREGRGYAIKQSDVNKMVEVINRSIQKYQSHFPADSIEAGVETVHIVTSESAAGTLKVGIESPKVVIGFPDSFSIGPLWKLDEKTGQTFRNQWLSEHINDEQDDLEYEDKFANTLRQIEDISQQATIHIWYGNNADEQTGMRFLLYLLRNKSNNITLINSTELHDRNIAPRVSGEKILHTGHIESKDLSLLFEKGSRNGTLSVQERMQFQEEWSSLAQTKDVLRLWVKDDIKGVNENHFDILIMNTLEILHRKQEKKDFIKVGMLIGEILSGTNELINAFFLEYRIRYLIYSGLLELKGIPKSMRHYSVKLR